ncbi:serpin family protein [Flavicella sediminum]|uniref:serpin family protein n=1 Tax=Flavicella sediminum TaxID=2585141 RepID=UPI00111E7473|nr:serpin family protein [Flavicella sediminum]
MKKILLHTIALVLLIAITACTSSNGLTSNPVIFKKTAKKTQLIESNNEFAFSFFKEVAIADEENYMVSPVSLSLALGMLYNGAETSTKSIMGNVLGYQDFTSDELSLVNQEIMQTLEGDVLQIANSNWIKEGFPIKETFTNLNQTYYDAEIRTENFSDPNTVALINNWVANKTNNKITEIIKTISPEAVLYLINAIYFNANWEYEFKTENTIQAPFYTDANNSSQVAMMQLQSDKLAFYKNELFSSLILPYKNNKYSMTLLLPNEGKNIADLVENIDGTIWNTWQSKYQIQKTSLSLPKFKFEYQNTLNDELAKLGLETLFGNPDLSGIAEARLKVSKVLQKTFIDVNEKGTEAAAVTVIGIETTSASPRPHVNCNKPFLFAITERETGAICFIGKVGKPEYSK